MGRLRRKPIPPSTDDGIFRTLARSSSPLSRHVQQFLHAGKSYIGAVPTFKPGTLVATGYTVSVVEDGHRATPDELAVALDEIENRRHEVRAVAE